jgi:hypothetical protein
MGNEAKKQFHTRANVTLLIAALVGLSFGARADINPPGRSESLSSSTACDPGWKPGTPVNGVGGTVYAIAADGAGNVYAGGSFAAAGSRLTNNIAKWDGNSWSPLGEGVNGQVEAIAVFGGEVYAGGNFTSAGGVSTNYLAKWNGSSWSAVGGGPDHPIADLAVSGSLLYAAGNVGTFESNGFVSVWNGSTWSALGPHIGGGISKIAASGENVYAARRSSNLIYKWSGSAWIQISFGMGTGVYNLAASGQDLYAVGYQYLGPTQGEAGYVARWNGSTWTTIGSGMTYGSDRWGYVYGVAVAGTDVYVSGLFSNAVVPANSVAKWNGSSWSAVGDWQIMPGPGSGWAVAASGSDVYFAGRFVSAGRHERRADGIAKWNGSSWSDLGDGAYTVPNAMTVADGAAYAAGYFTTDAGSTVSRLVRWNGSAWQPLTFAFPPGPAGWSLSIRAVAVSGTDAYVGGYWEHPNRLIRAGFVYKWNGSSWSELGTGMNGRVAAVVVAGSAVYAAGEFTFAGGVSAAKVAKWNGSSWLSLGYEATQELLTLTVSDNTLYAAGYSDRVAKWDGATWTDLDGGAMRSPSPDTPQNQFRAVTSLIVSGTDVYAAGAWDLSDYEDVGFVSKWNGSQWTPLTVCCGYVNSVVQSADGLYAGRTWGGTVAKFNGSNWADLGFGGNPDGSDSVGVIAVVGNELFVGSGISLGIPWVSGEIEGRFSTAGCNVSTNFARYSLSTATISGRVTTPGGQGIRNVIVSLIDEGGVRRTATTSSFGNYLFESVVIGTNYTVTVSSKRYRFAARTIVPSSNLTSIDFVGLE